MSQERLLKRIRRWSEDEEEGFSQPDLAVHISSLLDDLSKLYNTRQGTVVLDPEFGIPDFTSLMSNMSPPEVEKLTRAFILFTNKYEPRLKSLSIRFQQNEEDRGLIRFGVSSKIMYAENLTPLVFDILLQGDGSVALQIAE